MVHNPYVLMENFYKKAKKVNLVIVQIDFFAFSKLI